MKNIFIHLNNPTLHSLNAFLVALISYISLKPYILDRYSLLISGFLTLFSSILTFSCYLNNKIQIDQRQIKIILMSIVVLAYLSLLPTVDGQHKPWILLIPFVINVIYLPYEQLKLSVKIFLLIFICTLIPQVFYLLFQKWLYPIIKWQTISPLDPTKVLSGDIFYFNDGFSIYLNTVTFPLNYSDYFYLTNYSLNGFIWTRLTGLFLEPGVVGTMALLLLLANSKKTNQFTLTILGFLSFSLAFFLLYPVILIKYYRFIKIHLAACILFLILIFSLSALGGYGFLRAMFFQRINAQNSTDYIYKTAIIKLNLKNTEQILLNLNYIKENNIVFNPSERESLQFKILLQKYWKSDLKTIALGIASNASGIFGGDNFNWKIYLTNYGLFGFLFILLLFWFLLLSDKKWNWMLFIEFIAITLLIHQRPYFWLPGYFLILYFIGSKKQINN